MFIDKSNKYAANLMILLQSRLKENIIFICSDSFRLVIAKSQGFFALPLIPFEEFYNNDFQLQLLEYYLMQIRRKEQKE